MSRNHFQKLGNKPDIQADIYDSANLMSQINLNAYTISKRISEDYQATRENEEIDDINYEKEKESKELEKMFTENDGDTNITPEILQEIKRNHHLRSGTIDIIGQSTTSSNRPYLDMGKKKDEINLTSNDCIDNLNQKLEEPNTSSSRTTKFDVDYTAVNRNDYYRGYLKALSDVNKLLIDNSINCKFDGSHSDNLKIILFAKTDPEITSPISIERQSQSSNKTKILQQSTKDSEYTIRKLSDQIKVITFDTPFGEPVVIDTAKLIESASTYLDSQAAVCQLIELIESNSNESNHPTILKIISGIPKYSGLKYQVDRKYRV
ncbi:P protein [Puerto Almendras virus]|uniref:P protein n=1 Tax=Puerto Almendras virus TaxID=1479613 RepID=X4R562_9RHAB|nr:P protein [Puerto Almendras virus]AHU86503.1 P protein [Puerto Almendras virus]